MLTDPSRPIETLKFLIKNRCPGFFVYQGHTRTFCPYLLGATQDNRLVLHAYQFGGSSSRGPVTPESGAGWRYFYLDLIDGEPGGYPGGDWYPLDFKKSEAGSYKPPAFITAILAQVELPE